MPIHEAATKREEREDEHGCADVLTVEMNAVPAPVPIEDTRELREIHVDRFLERKRKTRGVVVAFSASPRGPRYVLLNGEILNGAHHGAKDDRSKRESQRRQGARRGRVAGQWGRLGGHTPRTEREKEREGAAREQHVLQELRVRREHRQPHDQREQPPGASPAIAHPANEGPKRGRQERADEQFPVVSRRRVGRDGPAEQIRDAAHDCAVEPHTSRPQESNGEDTGEKRVEHEAPRHRHVGRQYHPQQKRRVENVAVHRRDVWHAAELVRIPLRKALSIAERARRKLTEGIARDVLIRIRIHEKGATERWPREQHRRDKADERRPREREARCRWGGIHRVRAIHREDGSGAR